MKTSSCLWFAFLFFALGDVVSCEVAHSDTSPTTRIGVMTFRSAGTYLNEKVRRKVRRAVQKHADIDSTEFVEFPYDFFRAQRNIRSLSEEMPSLPSTIETLLQWQRLSGLILVGAGEESDEIQLWNSKLEMKKIGKVYDFEGDLQSGRDLFKGVDIGTVGGGSSIAAISPLAMDTQETHGRAELRWLKDSGFWITACALGLGLSLVAIQTQLSSSNRIAVQFLK